MYSKRLSVVAAAAVALAAVQAGPVLAGDVIVDSGAGTITGDQDDNEIALYSDDSGIIWVKVIDE